MAGRSNAGTARQAVGYEAVGWTLNRVLRQSLSEIGPFTAAPTVTGLAAEYVPDMQDTYRGRGPRSSSTVARRGGIEMIRRIRSSHVVLVVAMIGASAVASARLAGGEEPLVGAQLAQTLGLQRVVIPADTPTSNPCEGVFLEHATPDDGDGEGYCLPPGLGQEEVQLLALQLGGRMPDEIDREIARVRAEIGSLSQSDDDMARLPLLLERLSALMKTSCVNTGRYCDW
jgi:hypothetical protein